ncbi:MAG: cytochrome c3 family protein [Bdellovibrionales bacterium]
MRFIGLIVPLVLAMFAAHAEDEGLLNKLLAPGPLIKGHAHLEGSDCLKCHDAGKGVPDVRCLECHKEIKRDVQVEHSLHGRVKQACHTCHADHKGRTFNSMAFDINTFDHGASTGYVLSGKHADLKCQECHTTKHGAKSVLAGKIRYFGQQTSCRSCHKKDDVHFFKGHFAKKDCAECHDPRSWKEFTKFDHERDTKYKLEGKHAELKCADCHGPAKKTRVVRYQWPQLEKSQCLSCHKDFHANRLSPRFRGGNCATCHTQKSWQIEKFDHDKTKFHLGGKHAELKCADCHKPKTRQTVKAIKDLDFTGLKVQCLACHKDFHQYPRGAAVKGIGPLNNCATCHNDKTWKEISRFDHSTFTRYPIDGKHLELKCADCHIPKKGRPIYKWPNLTTKTCENCHKSPHYGQFSDSLLKKSCTECHVTSGWMDFKGGKGVDHSKTRFPLTGAHAKTKCTDCHGQRPKQKFKFPSFEKEFCLDCHTNVHTRQFSSRLDTTKCSACHTTKSFTDRLEFDHSKTRYPLEGKHAQVRCEECHRPAGNKIALTKPNVSGLKFPRGKEFVPNEYQMPKVKSDECLSCHTDYHRGQLGDKCLSCHAVTGWKPIKFDHDKQSEFKLRGKHAEAGCRDCHKPIRNAFTVMNKKRYRVYRFKPLGQQCGDCHKDPHKGSFGKNCSECHTEKGWDITRDFHRNFTLTGVHYSLQCAECHKDGRKLAGLSQQCISCHLKDDVHSGTLPNCNECHRQQYWDVSAFRHSMTLFPLRGAHRTLDCTTCHITGTYRGLSYDCSSCHLSDAMGATSVIHNPIGNFMNCTNCHHNQFSFKN